MVDLEDYLIFGPKNHEELSSLNLPNLDPRTINFDRFGILYAFCGMYFVVFEDTNAQSGESRMWRGWMAQQQIGKYLMLEWASFLKVRVEELGEGVDSREGWWNVHSSLVQHLRRGCLEMAQDIHGAYIAKGIPCRERDVGRYGAYLGNKFARVVDAMCGTKVVQKVAAAKEADKFMEEFMIFDN